MLSFFVVNILSGSYFNYGLWVTGVIGFLSIISVFSGINSSWKLFLVSTFFLVYSVIDFAYFMRTYPSYECVAENVAFDMHNGDKFSQSDVKVCRYKTTIEGEYGDWEIPQEK